MLFRKQLSNTLRFKTREYIFVKQFGNLNLIILEYIQIREKLYIILIYGFNG